ncbi:ATP-binding cassette domain-containing protein [Oceanicola sp. 502str15]|uniref:ATP-binding cassette domain-containing protein n=1 Tax=Oceanicola sp. 502str15 TaxID=2696061 RepID=UPI002095B749|nr:ATP-binding cassette domain-containing protein [Oceanicola sp. 502str15]MCO6384119.1 ATP-binding cassette domain-containing protein [Oceanicola sp. 502str15]
MDIAESRSAEGQAPIVSMRGISKHYGGVAALDNVDLEVRRGEVVALLGDNGAGKSTLVKILAGAVTADTGTIMIDGAQVELGTPARAKELGIEIIYQDLALCDNVDIPTNIFLGRELQKSFAGGLVKVFDRRKMAEETQRLLGDLRINISNINEPVRDLSGGQRQTIAIAKSVYSEAKLIIMDEPTAALGVAQQEQVLSLIENLRAKGEAIVLISHSMNDVMRVADRVVILKTGTLVTNRSVDLVDRDQLVRMIVSGIEEPPVQKEAQTEVEA